MPRHQFSLKTLLWLMVVVAAFFGGMAIQRQLDTPARISRRLSGFTDQEGVLHPVWQDRIRLRDGSVWNGVDPVEPSQADELRKELEAEPRIKAP